MSSKIKIDLNKGKVVTFELDVQGVESSNLNGKFRILVNEVEYGFPTKIKNNEVEVDIPRLKNILRDHSAKSVSARLDIYDNDQSHFVPWEGIVDIQEQAKIKAKVSTKKPVVKTIRKEDTDFDEQEEVIVDDPEPDHAVDLPEPTEKEKKKKFIEKKLSSKTQPQNESVSLNESSKQEYIEKLKNIDMKGIRNYMAKAGTRTTSVQNIILEQAENKCKDPDNKFELLRSVVKVMKELRRGGR